MTADAKDSDESGGPRVWWQSHPEPDDRPEVRDRHGDRWEFRTVGDHPGPAHANHWHNCTDVGVHVPWEILAGWYSPLTEAPPGQEGAS